MGDEAAASFRHLYGTDPEVFADAPGRVNLIGEHTDYHQGYVLPTVIPQRTHVALHRRTDARARVWSANISDGIEEFVIGRESPQRRWLDYVQGVTSTLRAAGAAIGGFDLRIESAIPPGAGVSSSAALEIALLRALRSAFALAFDDVQLAQLGQRVETDFVGAPVGIMDQMASSLGHEGEALFLDTRTLAATPVAIPTDAGLIVIDSGISHAHAGGEYAVRRRESFEAAALLGVEFLRDVPIEALPRVNALPPVLARRARHIITENARVLRAVDALRRGDLERLGALFLESHASMRDDYQTSTPAIDELVRLGEHDADVFGARLTGGGFGGAVVMLARAAAAADAAQRIVDAYRRLSGIAAAMILVPPDFHPESG